ncbi:hypothetical protein ACTMNS_14030, partial [Staphylococcus haemolyticus]
YPFFRVDYGINRVFNPKPNNLDRRFRVLVENTSFRAPLDYTSLIIIVNYNCEKFSFKFDYIITILIHSLFSVFTVIKYSLYYKNMYSKTDH